MRRSLLVVLLLLFAAAPAAGAAQSPYGNARVPYGDTSHVPIDPQTGEAVIAAARTPPDLPPESQVQDCVRQPADPANSQKGRVENRFLWCLRTTVVLTKLGDPTKAAFVNYTAVGYGRDDGHRSLAFFFRVDSIEKRGISGDSLMAVNLECRDQPEDQERNCGVAGGPHRGTIDAWSADHDWRRMTITSDEAGPLFDGVLRHEWRFVFSTENGPSDLVWHGMRCDSATYFRMGGERPKACIFTDTTPHLIYRTTDPRVTDIAFHIRAAQNAANNPRTTFPIFDEKHIPGKYLGGVPALHRLPSGTPLYDANRKEARDACRSEGRYVSNGLPEPPAPGEHCDEYPFASTYEGAAEDFVNFSVRGVNGSQNCSAGALLGWYFTRDRILYGTFDEFFVEILDGEPGGGDPDPPPPDTPPGGGEEEECAVIPPNPSPPPAVPVGQLRVSDLALTEGDSGTQDATVTISMSRPTGESVSVNWATANGTATAPDDYQARSGRVTFGPEERTKRITVPVNNDVVPEPDEHFFIRLSGATAGGSIVDGESVVTIRTDPEPSLSINDVRIEEEDADLTFTASLSEANNTPVGVDFATADGTATAGADYEARSGHVDIPVGSTSAAITVRAKEDFDDEIDEETFKVLLRNAVNVFVADGEGVATIRDDDRNGLFTCRAAAVRLGSAEYKVANPAEHPCRDDNQVNGLLQLRVGAIGVSLRTGSATDQTPDDLRGTKPAVGDIAKSHAEATDISISAGVNLVRVEGFVADAAAECASPPDAPRLSSSSRLTKVTVAGLEIPVGSNPVQVPLVLATLKLNETVRTANGVTQRALVLDQLLGPDLVLGEARAGWRGTAVHPNGHPCVV
jgi:hypothetical protein